jgi:ABC-type transport system substrate-binding protein
VETLVINDATARTNALLSKQVDVINRVDFKIVDALAKAPGCPCRKSDPDVLVMQSAEMGLCEDSTDALNFARNRRVLVQRQVRAGLVVICHVR